MQKAVPVEADQNRKLLETVDAWLTQKAVPLALIIIAVGLGFRIYYAVACYLNMDDLRPRMAIRCHPLAL